MLFDGFALHLSPGPDNVEGHPFHAANNINDTAIASIVDYQVLPLDPRVRALQKTYIRKVVDTVHDLPNVLSRETVPSGEVTVEGPTTTSFSAPFSSWGPAVLYLKKAGR